MYKIILVTGGQGAIGQGIIKKLVSKDYKFFSLDISGNDKKNSRWHLQKSRSL